jgi:hypothetical protein
MNPDDPTAPLPVSPAPPPPASAPEDPAAFFRQLGEQTSRVLTAAEEAGRGIRDQARRDAAGILAEARIKADELARSAASQRRAAEEELRRFREARAILANQIEDVHRRLEEIILRLKTPIDAPGGPGVSSSPPMPPATLPQATPVGAEEQTPAAEPAAQAGGGVPGSSPAGPPSGEHRNGRPGIGPAEGDEPVVSEASGNGHETGVTPPAEQGAPGDDVTAAATETAPAEAAATGAAATGATVPAIEPAAEVAKPAAEATPESGPESAAASGDPAEREAFRRRGEALGDAPLVAARSLKRLLQEDQNDLLDRIRRFRGRGTFESDILPLQVQIERFAGGLRAVLEPAFLAGRSQGGAPAIGDPPEAVRALVAKQVVAPLRRDLARMIEPRIAAGDTATTVSERAGDVYRVWKGVRTELLGEGLAYAAFHHGLLEAWREAHRPGKRWALSPDEADCPRDTCRTNATAGAVGLDASFPSGHLAPPAHGACTCTIIDVSL